MPLPGAAGTRLLHHHLVVIVVEFAPQQLLEGLDDIGLTMEKAGAIDSFEAQAGQARPWV